MTNELAAAIAAVKRATPANVQWTASDFSDDDNPPDIDQHIATILNAVVSGDLAEVIALRAEVDRLRGVLRKRSEEADSYEERSHVAEARSTAAEADAERLAKALDRVIDWTEWPLDRFGPIIQQAEFALADHTQRVNEKEGR